MPNASLFVLALLGLSSASVPQSEPEVPVPASEVALAKTIEPTEWLVLPAVDATGRRPFRPDRVFGSYLLDRDAAAPEAGQELHGETDTAEWVAHTAKKPGLVNVDFSAGWAYTAIESERGGVYMAKLKGGSRLFVGGAGFAGDVYGYGFGGVPVALEAGLNHVYITGLRGNPRLTLTLVEDDRLVAGTWDALIPDLVRGETAATTLELPIYNASTEPLAGGYWSAEEPVSPEPGGGSVILRSAYGVLPRAVPLAPFSLTVSVESKRALSKLSKPSLDLKLQGKWGEAEPADSVLAASLKIPAREPGETHRVVFPSAIDGSLQEYGLVERNAELATPGLAPSMVLSLHGAGVATMNQARAYGRKGDFWIAAALNRRPFGFDWQDWGRLDAYEALDHALAQTGVDGEHVFLTGHSMGAHGTWHLGANDPDRFLAIAPSAGWSTFDSYGGRPSGSLAHIWQAADGTSLTMDLIENLAQVPTFVLHGTADDNVPLSEAELMLKARGEVDLDLGEVAEVRSHFEPDAGHWWGNKCVDWPGIFEMFTERAKLIEDDAWKAQPEQFVFRTVDPGVDSKHHWVEVLQPRIYGQPIVVRAEWEPGARVLRLDAPNAEAMILSAPNRGRPIEWVVGETTFGGAASQRTLHVIRGERGNWVRARPEAAEKSPDFCGPFKRAFANNFVLVFGTAGEPDEDRELLERARYDLERWSYRAAGEVQLLSDTSFDELLKRGAPGLDTCNVILYGNADSNTVWTPLLGSDGELEVRNNYARVGAAEFEGDDLLMLFLQPRQGMANGAQALVGAFGSTGARGARMGYEVPVFVSGVGLPDWTLISSAVLGSNDPQEVAAGLTGGDEGVLGAGWFDHKWKLQEPLVLRE